MSGRRVAGLILVIVGVVALVWGGVFWTDRDTIVDAGPVDRSEALTRLVAGIVLLLVPSRRRA